MVRVAAILCVAAAHITDWMVFVLSLVLTVFFSWRNRPEHDPHASSIQNSVLSSCSDFGAFNIKIVGLIVLLIVLLIILLCP
jgi:hypothetical protein